MSVEGKVELVVASGKGGVGKSLVTSSLAIVSASNNSKLVVADADAEAPNQHIVLGVNDWDVIEPYYEGRIAYILEDKCTNCGICAEICSLGAVELKQGKYWINPYICEGCITCSINCPDHAIRYRHKIVAGWIRIKNNTIYGFPLVSGEIAPGRPNSGKLVTEIKNRASKIIGDEGLVLVDAAAGIGCQVISSLTGAQLSLLVTEPTPAGFSDLKRIHRLTKHFMIAPMLIINKFNINEDFISVIEDYARRENIPIMGLIPYDPNVPKSMARGVPLLKAYPKTPAAVALREISEKIVMEILPRWKSFRAKYRPRKPELYIPLIVHEGEGGEA